MPTWTYPAWPIRFEDLAGNGIDFPTEAMEWETSQSLRTAFENIPMADYQYDLLGTRRAPRDLATESIRFVKVGNSGPEVFAWLQQLRALLARVGRGRLWIRDGNGTRYWAYARPSEMPDVTFGVAEIRHVPVTLRFTRLSDWYSENESEKSFLARTSPTIVSISSAGTIETKRVTIRLGMPYTPTDLTVSGTVITDQLRSQTTPAHFDGRAPESSVGIWVDTTNLVTNGSFETNTNGWLALGATISRDTSTAKHGAASLKVVTSNASSGEGATTTEGTGGMAVTANQQYTASAWLWGSGTVRLGIRWFDSAGTALALSETANITLTSTPTRYALTATAPANAARAAVRVTTPTQQASTFWIDAVQFEQKPYATPYVHTDGATASRAGSWIQAPAALVSVKKGWVAGRIRIGHPMSQRTEPGVSFFDWQSGTNRILCGMWLAASPPHWRVQVYANGSQTGYVYKSAYAYTTGATVTVIGAWDTNRIAVSVDGSPFVSTTATLPAAMSAPTFTIGRHPSANQYYLDSELLWFACGTGTLTDADAAALAALGDTDPQPSNFPQSANLTCLWSCTRTAGWTVVNPSLEKLGEAMMIQVLRTFSSRSEIVEIDCHNNKVRYSNDNGMTWSDDWANVVIGDTQVSLFSVSPGTNTFRISFDSTSVDPELVVTLRWNDAFA